MLQVGIDLHDPRLAGVLEPSVLLLPVWGIERYGIYAAAVAAFSWLTALVFTGPEKTVLKLPRLYPVARRPGPLFVVVVVWSGGVNLLIYVLRVYEPQISLRQAGRAGHLGRWRAVRLAGAVAVYNALWLLSSAGSC